MQYDHLWAVNSSGITCQLNIKTHEWQQLGHNRQIEVTFKRVSTSPLSVWSVGGDHQIYIYVPITDIPIRVGSFTYENERWNPFNDFCGTLLPTDRSKWTSEDGTVQLPKESFLLPSKSWKWESDWYIDDNIEGDPLGPEGWTYAIDFPMQYASQRKWNSLVRRRKWVRYRRYIAVNQWALIESIHGDHVAEPFIDIATGGYEVPGGQRDALSVWAVTVLGRVMFRTGVDRLSPEGISWKNIEVPSGWECNQIACGPTGLVWAIAWDGSALVRSGVTRDNLTGITWLRVEPPIDSKLMQVSVGVDAVWAITRDGHVYFRKGVRGLNAGHNDASATGSGWVEMVHQMALVTVTANDQVWALSPDRRTINFRRGISCGELTGKSWKMITELPINILNANHNHNHLKTLNINLKPRHQSDDSTSVSSIDSLISIPHDHDHSITWIWISASCCSINADSYLSLASSSSAGGSLPSITGFTTMDVPVFSNNHEEEVSADWRLKILTQLQERYDKEMRDFEDTYNMGIESGTWIKSGTCFVFGSNSNWSLGHLELERQGVEGGTDSGTLTISYSLSSSKSSISSTSSTSSLKSSSSLSKSSKKIIYNLAEIIAVLCDTCDGRGTNYTVTNCLVIVTADDVLKLTFRSENELEDWITSVNLACGDVHGINGATAPSGAILWALTNHGDVYLGHCVRGSECKSLFYYHLGGGHFRQLTTSCGVSWALSYDGTLWIFSNGYGGGVYKGISGANRLCHPITDTMSMVCYENQRWNPLMGFAARGLPTDRYMWSNENGKIELNKDSIRLPSRHWQWSTDWSIDYTTPDGVDSEGFQYAMDFPFDYHPERRFTDYVRRRRWYRKCKLTTTGPWSDTGQNQRPLIAISLKGARYNSDSDINNINDEIPIAAWAVSIDGDALCRNGVTSRGPRGSTWTHVPCEQPLVDISVGGGDNGHYQVWAIAKDGTSFLRHGIGPKSLSGTVWFHIEPPRAKCPLKKIAVGLTTVWAIDEKHRLWYREEIVPTFPEGTFWKKVCDNCHHVAIDGDNDQLWAILEKKIDNNKSNDGQLMMIIAKRIGINNDNKIGTEWDYGHEQLNYFNFISISGCDKQL